VSPVPAHLRRAALRLVSLDAAFVGGALLVALLIKAWYRHATANALGFVLDPTVWLVELLSGDRFEREGALGYVSRTADFVIIPACAGINFLVVAFVSLVMAKVSTRRGLMDKLRFIAGAGLSAYGATIVANAARITCAIALRRHHLGAVLFTPARLHELEGVVVFLGALLALHALYWRAVTAFGWALGVPLGCYLGVTLLLPILDGEARGPRFAEHAALVLGLVAAVAIAAWARPRRRGKADFNTRLRPVTD
jgi:exosortase K